MNSLKKHIEGILYSSFWVVLAITLTEYFCFPLEVVSQTARILDNPFFYSYHLVIMVILFAFAIGNIGCIGLSSMAKGSVYLVTLIVIGFCVAVLLDNAFTPMGIGIIYSILVAPLLWIAHTIDERQTLKRGRQASSCVR
jgi:hypothetical protein